MSFRGGAVIAAAALVAAPALAAAQEEGAQAHAHRAAVSVSPVHLLLPMLEVTAEVYGTDRVSFAGIAGYGQVQVLDLDITVWEIGAQLRYYPLHTVQEGFYVGLEGMYAGASADEGDLSAVARGVALAGMAGYKWVWDSGFLIDLAGGAGRVIVEAESSEGDEVEGGGVGLLLNFNLGWAF